MKKISIFAFVVVLIISIIPLNTIASSDKNDKDKERTEIVALFGTLLAPSIFCSANPEKIGGVSIYGRIITGEGEVPDFGTEVKDNIDSLQIYLNGRVGRFGATLGFGQGNEFEFSQPLILSVDYKLTLLKSALLNAAVDGQYSTIYLPDEKTMKVSAPGFGVASINGLISANILFLLEPYAGVTLNYVYLNSKDDLYTVWKAVPKLGLKVKLLPFVSVGSEVSFLMNDIINDSWLWNFGASVKF
ncbi:MAG: hypothetical protein AAB116_22140 [Candidatus Poribacteria bacterium]